MKQGTRLLAGAAFLACAGSVSAADVDFAALSSEKGAFEFCGQSYVDQGAFVRSGRRCGSELTAESRSPA